MAGAAPEGLTAPSIPGSVRNKGGERMGLFTESVETKTQLYFRDTNKFKFVRRPLKFSCLVEMSRDIIKQGWKHFYATELPFAGYRKIPASMVTLGFPRDIILDPFNKIPVGEDVGQKPKKSGEEIKKWIARIAENQRQTYRAKYKTSFWTDKIMWTEIGIIALLSIILAVRALT